MKTWLTSDNHFYHANVILYCDRPFISQQEKDTKIIYPESVNKMNEVMIANWNKVVAPGDRVIHVGDFAMAARAVETVLPRLNGNIELYLGNHDFPHPAHEKGKKIELRNKWTLNYLNYGFKHVSTEGSLCIEGVADFRICHLPYEDPFDTRQDGTPRHFEQRPKDDGVPQICGHVHNKWLFMRTSKGTPMLNVGVDAPGAPWSGQFRPASLDEVIQIYLEKTRSE